jgi:hypothetical protein
MPARSPTHQVARMVDTDAAGTISAISRLQVPTQAPTAAAKAALAANR